MTIDPAGGRNVQPETYLLRFNAEQGRLLARALQGASNDYGSEIGRKLELYFKPDMSPGGCADCGGSGAEFTSPESCALTEVWIEGLKAYGEIRRVICRQCLRRYYVNRGQADPFPQDEVEHPLGAQ